jgi:hypothetical protein
MSHTDSPVGYTHSDGEVICPGCHKYLGMDQAAECTAVYDPSDHREGVKELAGKCCTACDTEYRMGYFRPCSDGDLEWIDARWKENRNV